VVDCDYVNVYARDITRQKQAEYEIRRLSVAVEQSPAMVVITDVEGTIEYVNPMFTEITGYTAEEVIGQNPRILSSGKTSPEDHKRMWRTILLGETWRGEYQNKKKNGELYWEASSISPIKNSEGTITHFVAIKEDITPRKQVEEELLQAALAANRAKSDFLANMSHEIRTPMTAILGYVDLIEENVKLPENIESIGVIKRNGKHLLNLINDILDLSKVEAGKMTAEWVPCSPCQIVGEIASLMEVKANAKGLRFEARFEGPAPETIHSDPTRVRQMLINLVGNAVKFTQSGEVRLVMHLLDKTGGEPALQFEVIDTGIGMDDEQLAQLFQPFMQADTSTTRTFGGTGLGLTISQRFAEILGGEITVTSTPGEGSTFRLTIPTGPLDGIGMVEGTTEAARKIEQNSPTPSLAESIRESESSGIQGRRVLLAEDAVDNQRLISFVLKKAGAEVIVAENGQIAVDLALAAQAEDEPFDVILMDMQMPILDGYDATKRLRKDGCQCPIIALTAHAMVQDRKKCIAAGCDDYATKPIDRTRLLELIADYSARKEGREQETDPTSRVRDLTADNGNVAVASDPN
ncbi:MAG: PAS domain S-box protein, partial [Planctomycetaceae bacterium]|nr:PAS domain S-box protein [Planctomycetaceae bacterium]